MDFNEKHLSRAKCKNLKSFQCIFCSFSTKWNCALSKQPYKCEICQGVLKRHQKTVHENEKPHKCDKSCFKVKPWDKTRGDNCHLLTDFNDAVSFSVTIF